MCYAYGSLDQAINVCPMCKVFPNTRCPHVRDVCRNRALHPRLDVLFLKNAEVNWFNGCGYCKWARTNPPPKLAGYHNPGWPGCCRPPASSEHGMIQAADWRSVSLVHHIPIPSEIKAALDNLSLRGSPVPASSSSSGRSSGGKSSISISDRKNTGNASPSTKSNSISGKSLATPVPNKGRPGGSPRQISTPLASNLSRSSSGNAISSSVPTTSNTEQYHMQRRQTYSEQAEKRLEVPQSSHSSPSCKNIDLEAPVNPRRYSGGRPTIAAVVPSISISKIVVDTAPQSTPSSLPRHASVSSSNSPPRLPAANYSTSSDSPRASKKEGDISSASSSSGSDGPGSMTDSTITSDGGFTDYLSDESEAELQRQAEARAVLVAQNQAEELEFKAARQQLAHVDLRPPTSWNPSNISNISNISAPRLPGSTPCPPSVPHTITPYMSTAAARTGGTQTGS